MTNNRRKRKIGQHSIERKYLLLVSCAMFVPAALISGCLYYLIWQTLAYEFAIPELIYQTLVPAYNRINSILIVGTPIIFGVILFFAIRFSHRFAGPIQRIEDELDKMLKSRDFQHTVRIRPSDDLAPLIRKMNQVIRGANDR